MNYTTIKQSEKLLELGLSPKTADMWWLYVTAQGKHIAMMYEEPDPHYLARMKSYGIKNAAIPCWSLGALLKLIPNYQLQTQDKGVGILFSCRKELKIIEASAPIEAVYNMVCWLLENRYIKKGE